MRCSVLGLTTFGKDIALATGFGPSGIVLLHLISRMRGTPVFYLQTDLLFPETLESARPPEAEQRGIQFTEIRLISAWKNRLRNMAPGSGRATPTCAAICAKLEPLQRFLAKKAWIT